MQIFIYFWCCSSILKVSTSRLDFERRLTTLVWFLDVDLYGRLAVFNVLSSVLSTHSTVPIVQLLERIIYNVLVID